ncbi:hypothetical protein BH18ACI5_BH18ACI5_05230 [soil metagenome]
MARGFLSLVVLGLTVIPADAQFIGRPTPRRGTLEFSGGALFHGGSDQPNLAATLTRNPTTGSSPLELFNADVELKPAFGLQARLGVYLTPRISIEGGVDVARPKLEVRLTDDFEAAADETASETLTSYVFTGSVLYHFGAPAKRVHPFVMGGAGHVRDLHEGSDLVATGLEYHGGAGVKWWLGKGRPKAGIRGDIGVSVREGGYGTEDGRRIVPTAGFSFAYLF